MKFDWRRLSLRLLALFFAVVLWVYVTNEQFPASQQVYNVPLEVKNQVDYLVVSGIPEYVSVRAEGLRSRLLVLRPSDIKASIDLAQVQEGENNIRVAITSPPDVKIVQVTPEVVKVSADRRMSKQMPVVAQLQGEPQRGYVAGQPSVSPPTVTVSGPKKILDSMQQFTVSVNLQGAAQNIEQNLPVTVRHELVSVSPRLVKVSVPVLPLPDKYLPVRVELTGQPAEGYRVEKVLVSPAQVRVQGEAALLATLSELPAEPVDLSGASESFSRTVRLLPPAGVLCASDTVQVQVVLQPLPQQAEQPPQQ
ncbi:CdaR family protein [Desulfurispora thermophila]|uniref:CdaR family protein n=1 Tax=Desulfurispora thermophila TaxID=265470 RepID=UPI001FA77609|nr:CdaR family protein [Desulfurispora thermophila]